MPQKRQDYEKNDDSSGKDCDNTGSIQPQQPEVNGDEMLPLDSSDEERENFDIQPENNGALPDDEVTYEANYGDVCEEYYNNTVGSQPPESDEMPPKHPQRESGIDEDDSDEDNADEGLITRRGCLKAIALAGGAAAIAYYGGFLSCLFPKTPKRLEGFPYPTIEFDDDGSRALFFSDRPIDKVPNDFWELLPELDNDYKVNGMIIGGFTDTDITTIQTVFRKYAEKISPKRIMRTKPIVFSSNLVGGGIAFKEKHPQKWFRMLRTTGVKKPGITDYRFALDENVVGCNSGKFIATQLKEWEGYDMTNLEPGAFRQGTVAHELGHAIVCQPGGEKYLAALHALNRVLLDSYLDTTSAHASKQLSEDDVRALMRHFISKYGMDSTLGGFGLFNGMRRVFEDGKISFSYKPEDSEWVGAAIDKFKSLSGTPGYDRLYLATLLNAIPFYGQEEPAELVTRVYCLRLRYDRSEDHDPELAEQYEFQDHERDTYLKMKMAATEKFLKE